MTNHTPAGTRRSQENPAVGVVRQTVDLVVVLCLGVLMFRTFSAEAYVVPTGSMAPTLMGHHRELTCPNCGFVFVIGVDEEGHPPRPVCPNCGKNDLDRVTAVECNGDRVLVQKFLYDFRPPRRWEVAVFHFPGEPAQAYVKRVVGLPGESVQIVDGNVVIDGRVARKSLDELRAMQILVHDSRYVPHDSDRFPRWVFLRTASRHRLASGWSQSEGRFAHAAVKPEPNEPDDRLDWLVYRHWDPVLNRYGPIRDHYAYNGGDLGTDNVAPDLSLEARLTLSSEVEMIAIVIRSGGDRFVVRIPVKGEGSVEVARNDHKQLVVAWATPLAEVDRWPCTVMLQASVVDHRLTVTLDGQPLFQPLDYDNPFAGPPGDESPIALGVQGGAVSVTDLKIFRDVYYTSALGSIPRHPHGVNEPYLLKDDVYFVLGDNSPVSNDSRFWSGSPVVPRSMFLGKPFLVHLPGQVVALEVFGRSVYWVPDPRRIRYIY
ncbi:MAG: signal peptidase I [Isosphaeraceae bacterium]